jgi:hypothetical protein
MHDAMFLAVRELPGGVPMVAGRLGMKAGYLQKCLQRGCDTHQLSYERAGQIIELCTQLGRDDLAELMVNAFCWRAGRTSFVLETDEDDSGSVLRAALDVGRKHGELLGGVDDALADGRIDRREQAALEVSVKDHIDALTRLLTRLRSNEGQHAA